MTGPRTPRVLCLKEDSWKCRVTGDDCPAWGTRSDEQRNLAPGSVRPHRPDLRLRARVVALGGDTGCDQGLATMPNRTVGSRRFGGASDLLESGSRRLVVNP